MVVTETMARTKVPRERKRTRAKSAGYVSRLRPRALSGRGTIRTIENERATHWQMLIGRKSSLHLGERDQRESFIIGFVRAAAVKGKK